MTALTSPTGLASPLRSMPVPRSELSLPAVLKSGQAFRWTERKLSLAKPGSDPSEEVEEVSEWSSGWQDRTIVLRQDDTGVHYRSYFPSTPSGASSHAAELPHDSTLDLLTAYFALADAPLSQMYADWGDKDPKFRKIMESGQGEKVAGLRVCKQDEWETLVAFICSSNNNIPRITLMLSRLCHHFGTPLPSPPAGSTLPFHTASHSEQTASSPTYAFPEPEALTGDDVEAKLRELGFGYRAGYVASTARLVCSIAAAARSSGSWPPLDPDDASSAVPTSKIDGAVGPKDYLRFIGRQPYPQAHQALMQFAGVGPKVADCVALFGLGMREVVPVDVHVFQIAQKTYHLRGLPSSGAPSKVHYAKVRLFFKDLWGPWAGWAQQVVFAADLRGFQVDSPGKGKVKKEEEEEVRVKEEEKVTPRGERFNKRSAGEFLSPGLAATTPSAPPTSPSSSLVSPLPRRKKQRTDPSTRKTEVVVEKVEKVEPEDQPTLGTVPLSASTFDGPVAEKKGRSGRKVSGRRR